MESCSELPKEVGSVGFLGYRMPYLADCEDRLADMDELRGSSPARTRSIGYGTAAGAQTKQAAPH